MFKNYLITAWRNLAKNGTHSFINIIGLSVGMAVSFMLLLYVYNEFSFDRFNINSNNLYRVLGNQKASGEIKTSFDSPGPLAAAMEKDFAEVDRVARTNWPYNVFFTYKDKAVKINVMESDTSLLDMFSFQFIKGTRNTAFAEASSIVLTESGAKTLFGNKNPIGQVIKYQDKFPLTVSGVIKDNPDNSSFAFNALLPWQALKSEKEWINTAAWGYYSFQTYVMLKPGVNLNAFNVKLDKITSRYDPEDKDIKIFLYPFSRIHLYSDFKNGVNVGGRIEYVRLFLFLAIGILIIACINFMNLSTARSETRSREVGVRKAIGAGRLVLIQQFMMESLLMAFIALGVAILLVLILLPFFNNLIRTHLELPVSNSLMWVAVIAITLLTGLLAGSYPAIFLSSFKPIIVLKAQVQKNHSSVKPRQILVVTQFTFSVCLILFSLFIYRQINFVKQRSIGYKQDGLIEMNTEGSIANNFETFRQRGIDENALVDGALTSGTITNNASSTWGVSWPGILPGEENIPIDQIAVTYHFINTYGLQLSEGRDYDISRPADSNGIILNEAAVKLMRLEDPLGKQIKYHDTLRTIIGIVKDFVWGSPFEPVKPAIIGFIKNWRSEIGLRLNPLQPVSKSLATLAGLYKQFNPKYPFVYTFAEDEFTQKFNTEKLLGTMASGFTALAIIISCLGLFGLASFSARQKRKEIGIRKVLGSSVGHIWLRLSGEFIKLIFISFLIGSIASWYLIGTWLSSYTYHTSLDLWLFVATLLLSVLLCLLTVSWQAIKAALTNPVSSLRTE